jgi:hypothetical protein
MTRFVKLVGGRDPNLATFNPHHLLYMGTSFRHEAEANQLW